MTKFVSHVLDRKPDQFKQAVLSHLKSSIFPKLEQMKQEIGAAMFKGDNKTITEGAKSVPANIKRDIEKTAKAARRAGDKVEINYGLPYVSVKVGHDEYFFQEHEASDLLDEVPDNVNDEDYILWVAQGW